MKLYNHKEKDKKWQKKWEEEKIYATDVASKKEKWYGLVEFPYPSGTGLHVGHVRSYTGMDIIARTKRSQGYEVMFPIGWDAFGLPAENYAIKTGIHPSITTKENIDNFRRQLKACGFSFDWDREISTIDPEYYKWTQWIFLKMYDKGLAYKKEMLVNWCPKDKCVLANEEVLDGACERCFTEVEKKSREQWMLGITKYAERLDKDLDDTTYLERIKIQQRNWIGMSEGAEIAFDIEAQGFETGKEKITVFTTRADTLFGCTYCVLAPEHPLVQKLVDGVGHLNLNKDGVQQYITEARLKKDIDRSAEGKEKTGVRLEGVYAINPANEEKVPVYIADYVLPHYGTGAIMAVPAHDERDYQFAKKYNIDIRQVIQPVRIDKSNPHKKEYPTVERNMVHGVIRDPKTNKFLMLNWKSNPWTTFVLGGVEEGEDEYKSILREIKEETGLSNLKFLYKSITAYSEYCANHKQQNRVAHPTAYFFEITDETKQEEITDEEKSKHTIKWIDISKALPENFTCSEWDIFLQTIKSKGFYPNSENGRLCNSSVYNGLTSEEAKTKITKDFGGKIVKKSKMRDWVFARQRYWGEPIPLVYDEEGVMHPVHESELPIILPMVTKYEPTDNGKSPLAIIDGWVNVTGYLDGDGYFHSDSSVNAKKFTRETDTMPQWAGSSWYFMRYIDSHNKESLGKKEMLAKWLPVDWYNGGMEHTTLHLLYSRFWYKFLFDIGVVPTSEPYYKRTSQGMILGEGGVKMSKSLGNVVNPDEIIEAHGADTLRIYEMFIGPFDQATAWNAKAVLGARRFLDKIYNLKDKVIVDDSTLTITHQTIKKVTEDIESMSFNTAVSQMMIWANEVEKETTISKKDYTLFLQLLTPFAPHVAEDLWDGLGESGSIHHSSWPSYDETKLVNDTVTIAIQIGGKMRGTIDIQRDSEDTAVCALVKSHEMYKKYVGETEPKKVIIVKNKIVNIVL